jgi:alpha-beta hydrolase superfamily lysophospholipase
MNSLISVTLMFVTILQSPSPAQQPPPSDVIAHAQAVLASIVASEFTKVEEQFTGDMKVALPPGRLAATWRMLLDRAGAYQSCGTDVRVRRIADKEMVITPCEFGRAKIDVQFAFDSARRISGLAFRPSGGAAVPYTLPSYASPSSYAETATTVGSGEWVLPATLTMPTGTASVPAVVLVHGSGPNDRDETVGANKPFKDLATGLASRGIAVLRYDKRTRVHGAKAATLTDFTVAQEVLEDVLEAVKALRAQPRIDSARVFVLGHSLGGMLIPRIGTADPTIAGLIVLAGAARPLEEAMVAQTRYLAAADGTISSEEQQGIDRAAALVDSVRALKPEDAKSGRMISGAPASYWLDLRGYDAPSAARHVTTPMLILQGERDYQVTPEEFARWKAALGSRRDVTFHSYPTLNHLFIAGTGPSLPTEYQVPGHVAADVIRDIATWILAPR